MIPSTAPVGLSNARAAIVIWTKASVGSEIRYVRDEAGFALHKDKLVATKVSELDVCDIPASKANTPRMSLGEIGLQRRLKSWVPGRQLPQNLISR
jgi:hypothetical protein